MLGAIIGDIVGSRFEFIEHSGKDFPLFTSTCHFTDDSLMTLAVAKLCIFVREIMKILGKLLKDVWWISHTDILTSVGVNAFTSGCL